MSRRGNCLKGVFVIFCLCIMMATISGCNDSDKDTLSQNKKDDKIVIDTTGIEYDDYVVKVPLSSSLCGAPMHMAAEQGYFDEVGLKYEFVKTGDAAVQDLIATDKIDASMAMLPNTVLYIDQGIDIRVAVGNHTGCLQVIVPADSDIKDVTDLKNKKIGVPGMGSSGRVFAQRVLLSAGVGATADNMEIEFVAFSGAELAMALENKLVDAVATNDPNAAKIVDSGIGKTLISNATDPNYKDEYCCVTIMNPNFVEKHPVAAEKFLMALQKAGEFINANPEETARLQIEKGYVPEADISLYANSHKSYNYTISVEGGEKGLRNNMQDLKEIGMINPDIDIENVIKNVYIEFKNFDSK